MSVSKFNGNIESWGGDEDEFFVVVRKSQTEIRLYGYLSVRPINIYI